VVAMAEKEKMIIYLADDFVRFIRSLHDVVEAADVT